MTDVADGVFGLGWEGWFSVAGPIAMLGWMILIFAPRRWTLLNLVPAFVLPAVLSIGYGILIFLFFAQSDGGFDSLQAVASLFQSKPLLLAGWVHYLAFDLFIGAWIARQSDRVGISRLLQAPVLFSTFMFGPLGLIFYLAMSGGQRWIRTAETQSRKELI